MKKHILLHMTIQALFFAFCLTATGSDATEESVEELFEISFEELLDQTVVTATKAPQRLSETPATVRVVTAKQIKERGYLTLEEVLSDLPGIQFRNIQGFNSYVFMRGAPSQNNLILLQVDGIEINELNSGGFYGGGQFNLENVKRVEVVYGPASTLYGTNAMSGVVNIITWDPEDPDAQGTWVSGAGGRFDTWTTDFRTAYYNEEKRFGFSLSGMYKTTEKADLEGGKGDKNWTAAMENFEHDFAFDGKLKFRDLTFGFVYQDKKASRTTNYKTINADKLDFGTEWHITFMNLWLKHTYDITDRIQLNSLLYYRDATVEDDTIAFIDKASGSNPGRQAGYYRPNTQVGFEEQLIFRFSDRLNLMGGLSWEEEELSEGFSRTFSESQYQEPPTPGRPPHITEHLLSFYVQGQLKLAESLELTLGVRRDDSSAYDDTTSPRCGLVYKRGKFIGKFLYSEAFRAPKPWDFTSGSGNPGLSPEEMESFEGFLGYYFNPNLRAEVSLYQNTIEKLLTFNSLANRWENQGELETKGVEVTFNCTFKKLSAYCNYTFTDSENDNGDQEPEIARHGANIGLTYTFDKYWKFNIRGNYLGERETRETIPATGNDDISSAFLVHADFACMNFRNWDFHLIVKNLFDKKYYHASNRPPERYRQPQRTVLFKAQYRF